MAPTTHPRQPGPEPRTAAVRDIDVRYADHGSGHPVLLLHGHPFDHTLWHPQIHTLADHGFRAIAPDLRGYGHSTVVEGTTCLDTFARDLCALLDHLQIPATSVVGTSMGGQIALELYRLFPDRIDSLTLVATDPRPESPQGHQRRHELADRLAREGMQGYADEMIVGMMSADNVRTMAHTAARVHTMMCQAPPQGAAAALRGRARRPDHLGLLRHISAPALLVVGDQDAFTPPDLTEAMHLKIADSVVARIDGAGHTPNLERPEAFDRALLSFLERVRADLRP
ncbi:alpha/beta fold hydrolase [Nocardiopsis coralli]|uniref:alpha/beta fold hydrolase n=1 Tax=Nocardiopsis coralli TaxID=2772213 RepID=UPI002E2BF0C3|nr:alpha/beta fold hydrolase [Nocardiopsis coralli]